MIHSRSKSQKSQIDRNIPKSNTHTTNISHQDIHNNQNAHNDQRAQKIDTYKQMTDKIIIAFASNNCMPPWYKDRPFDPQQNTTELLHAAKLVEYIMDTDSPIDVSDHIWLAGNCLYDFLTLGLHNRFIFSFCFTFYFFIIYLLIDI